MKKFVVVAIILAASSTGAFAKQITGMVSAIDKSHDSVTLSDGKTFTLPEGIEAESLKVGEKVKVVYSSKAGKLHATSVGAAH
ncbi:DUF1344 domain-containing protein [Manganibacter manganicus]|uniref:DUF1344 domain-containing protein n=1 Tax=Manganibacter manganicus TaxID=1873176 RepID=A0A1V8RNB0_9HYPH|nr:DUF1344 domain-containing protein [Pseudaminobacter manganicus]OQM74646.1 hypothetical protein BFN67_21005 [Pseudaminobacter manganicus]